MNVTTTTQPLWAEDAFLRGFWVATGETPDWIAARTDALLEALGTACGVREWVTHKGDRWEGGPEDLTAIVRRYPVRDRPTAAEPDGESLPGEGYSFIVSGPGAGVEVEVRVAAGSAALADRLPMHTLSIKLRQQSPGSVTADLGDAVCAAAASAWRPATVKLTDSVTNRTARRGDWKIGVGYRTWISAEVGTISRVAEGLTASELAGGTLISAPDDWPAEKVVAAMTETLSANELDEVPH